MPIKVKLLTAFLIAILVLEPVALFFHPTPAEAACVPAAFSIADNYTPPRVEFYEPPYYQQTEFTAQRIGVISASNLRSWRISRDSGYKFVLVNPVPGAEYYRTIPRDPRKETPMMFAGPRQKESPGGVVASPLAEAIDPGLPPRSPVIDPTATAADKKRDEESYKALQAKYEEMQTWYLTGISITLAEAARKRAKEVSGFMEKMANVIGYEACSFASRVYLGGTVNIPVDVFGRTPDDSPQGVTITGCVRPFPSGGLEDKDRKLKLELPKDGFRSQHPNGGFVGMGRWTIDRPVAEEDGHFSFILYPDIEPGKKTIKAKVLEERRIPPGSPLRGTVVEEDLFSSDLERIVTDKGIEVRRKKIGTIKVEIVEHQDLAQPEKERTLTINYTAPKVRLMASHDRILAAATGLGETPPYTSELRAYIYSEDGTPPLGQIRLTTNKGVFAGYGTKQITVALQGRISSSANGQPVEGVVVLADGNVQPARVYFAVARFMSNEPGVATITAEYQGAAVTLPISVDTQGPVRARRIWADAPEPPSTGDYTDPNCTNAASAPEEVKVNALYLDPQPLVVAPGKISVLQATYYKDDAPTPGQRVEFSMPLLGKLSATSAVTDAFGAAKVTFTAPTEADLKGVKLPLEIPVEATAPGTGLSASTSVIVATAYITGMVKDVKTDLSTNARESLGTGKIDNPPLPTQKRAKVTLKSLGKPGEWETTTNSKGHYAFGLEEPESSFLLRAEVELPDGQKLFEERKINTGFKATWAEADIYLPYSLVKRQQELEAELGNINVFRAEWAWVQEVKSFFGTKIPPEEWGRHVTPYYTANVHRFTRQLLTSTPQPVYKGEYTGKGKPDEWTALYRLMLVEAFLVRRAENYKKAMLDSIKILAFQSAVQSTKALGKQMGKIEADVKWKEAGLDPGRLSKDIKDWAKAQDRKNLLFNRYLKGAQITAFEAGAFAPFVPFTPASLSGQAGKDKAAAEAKDMYATAFFGPIRYVLDVFIGGVGAKTLGKFGTGVAATAQGDVLFELIFQELHDQLIPRMMKSYIGKTQATLDEAVKEAEASRVKGADITAFNTVLGWDEGIKLAMENQDKLTAVVNIPTAIVRGVDGIWAQLGDQWFQGVKAVGKGANLEFITSADVGKSLGRAAKFLMAAQAIVGGLNYLVSEGLASSSKYVIKRAFDPDASAALPTLEEQFDNFNNYFVPRIMNLMKTGLFGVPGMLLGPKLQLPQQFVFISWQPPSAPATSPEFAEYEAALQAMLQAVNRSDQKATQDLLPRLVQADEALGNKLDPAFFKAAAVLRGAQDKANFFDLYYRLLDAYQSSLASRATLLSALIGWITEAEKRPETIKLIKDTAEEVIKANSQAEASLAEILPALQGTAAPAYLTVETNYDDSDGKGPTLEALIRNWGDGAARGVKATISADRFSRVTTAATVSLGALSPGEEKTISWPVELLPAAKDSWQTLEVRVEAENASFDVSQELIPPQIGPVAAPTPAPRVTPVPAPTPSTTVTSAPSPAPLPRVATPAPVPTAPPVVVTPQPTTPAPVAPSPASPTPSVAVAPVPAQPPAAPAPTTPVGGGFSCSPAGKERGASGLEDWTIWLVLVGGLLVMWLRKRR